MLLIQLVKFVVKEFSNKRRELENSYFLNLVGNFQMQIIKFSGSTSLQYIYTISNLKCMYTSCDNLLLFVPLAYPL